MLTQSGSRVGSRELHAPSLLTRSKNRLIWKDGGSRKQYTETVKKYCNIKEYNMEIILQEYNLLRHKEKTG